MLPLRYGRIWLAIGLLTLLFGLFSALDTSVAKAITLNDKLIHFTGFLGFMLWFGGLFERRHLVWVALALCGYGVLIEVLQSFTRTRHAEGFDVVADVSGVLIGWLLGLAGLSRWCMKLESWLGSRNP